MYKRRLALIATAALALSFISSSCNENATELRSDLVRIGNRSIRIEKSGIRSDPEEPPFLYSVYYINGIWKSKLQILGDHLKYEIINIDIEKKQIAIEFENQNYGAGIALFRKGTSLFREERLKCNKVFEYYTKIGMQDSPVLELVQKEETNSIIKLKYSFQKELGLPNIGKGDVIVTYSIENGQFKRIKYEEDIRVPDMDKQESPVPSLDFYKNEYYGFDKVDSIFSEYGIENILW